VLSYKNEHELKTWRDTYEQLRKDGYDGYIDWDTEGEAGTREFVAFSPAQIKSATDNRGTFDPINPDINYARQRQLEADAKVLRGKGEQAAIVAADFENRLKRIAPALMLKYKALVGDYDSLFSSDVGIRPEQLDGTEQAAHIVGAKTRILWFLQQNLRADKNGLMDERLRRDVLHEASHAWLNTLETDRKEFLFREWQRDIKATDGFVAQMKEQGVELREGVGSDWAEYWAERLAYENSKWASKREKWSIAGDRGLLAQIYAEFRKFLSEAIDLLQRAFTRTKRYNIDFRSFLTDVRYGEKATVGDRSHSGGSFVNGPSPVPVAAAREAKGRSGNDAAPNREGLRPKVQEALLNRARAQHQRLQIHRQTKLSFAQWQQAHSPQFKAWFGDWQALRAQQLVDEMQPVELQLDEKLRGKSLEELREAVETHLDKLAEAGVAAKHYELGEIGFAKGNTGKSRWMSVVPEKLHATLDIVRVLEAAHLVETKPSDKPKEIPHGTLYHTLGTKVTAFDREFVAVITVKELHNGLRFYNTIAVDGSPQKSPVGKSPRNSESGDSAIASALHGAERSKLPLLKRVNPDSVSKAVDPQTGEPQIFYHGGAGDFTQLRDQGRFGQLLFLREGKPSGYGKATYPLYLRGKILNPSHLADVLETARGEKLLRKYLGRGVSEEVVSELIGDLRQESPYPDSEAVWDALGVVDEADAQTEYQTLLGHLTRELGFSAMRIADEFDGQTLAVVDPTAIKSAIGNNGDFDASNPDIAFARAADEGRGRSTGSMGNDAAQTMSEATRLARNLHELEELNYRIDELKDAQTRKDKDAHRKLLGERNEKRMFIDEVFSGWRKQHPQLADGQVVDARATRKRILEHDLKKAEQAAERGNTFAEKHATALRRTLQREYPARVDGSSETQARPPYVRNDSGNATPVIDTFGQVNNDASQRAQARAGLLAMSPVPVSGLDPTLSGKPLRDAAYNVYKEAAEDGLVQMRDGRLVELTGVGFKKVRSHSADRKLLDLFTSIREVLEKAVPIASLPHVPVDHTDSIKAWHYYGAKVAFGKQELYAKLVVRESVNGEIYYDTNFSSLEKEAVARDGDAIPDKPEAAPRLSDDMHTLSELLGEVKAEAASINEGRSQADTVRPPLLGHTNIPPKPGQTVWQWLTDFIKGFRNFVPEVSPRDTHYAPLRQFYKAIKRATPQNQARVQDILGRIVKPLLDAGMGKAEADTYRKLGLIQQRIRKLEKAGEGKPDVQTKNLAELGRLDAQVAQLNAQLESQPYHLFNKLILAEDYVWRAENLKDKDGQPIALPDGITLDQAKPESARLQALANAHPQSQAINRAVQSHLELVAETWAELERRFPELRAGVDTEGRATSGSTQTTAAATGRVPQNPYYFPHHILNDKHPAKLARVRLDTAEEIRKYLIEPVGSVAPIETDYAKAMSLHLSAVYAHNSRADLVRDLIKTPYDKMAELRERAKELSEERGERVSWVDVFNEEYKHSGYVRWTPDDRLHLHSEAIVSKEKLAKRLGIALGDGDLQTELAKAGITQLQLLPSDIREALTPNAKEEWIIPEKVAQALGAMIDRESRFEGSDLGSGLVRSLEAAQNLWKKHILFSPWNYIRYEYNNTTSDLEKLFSADPAVFGYLPSSLREVMDLFAENPERPPTVEARIAKALGVMQSVTIREAGDLPQLKQFAALKARPERLRDIAKAASTLFLANGRSTIELSQLREATFRYAKFKADLDRMRNAARPVYAGAYHKDIEALRVTEDHLNTIMAIVGERATNAEGHIRNDDVQKLAAHTDDVRRTARAAEPSSHAAPSAYLKAAEISLATFGDYDTISVSGAALRKMMIPFYSWIEINFRYHANLFRNLRDMAKAGEMSTADARKAGTRAAGVLAATFTRRVAAYTAGRLLLPYLAVAMWNNSGDNEEIEEELSAADRRRFHINLGRDSQGRARVIYAATALGDIMKWFGGDDMMRLAADLAKGRTTFARAVEHYSTQFLPDLANNFAGGIGPVVKAGYTLASGKDPFPDITDQRTIPAYDLKWNILSQMTDGFTADMIRRVLDKDYLAPRDLGDWAQQLILQVRKRDAASWSFYAIKDKAADWNERRTGKSRGSSDYNSPEMQVLRNYRRAIYKGDVKNAVRFYDRLLEFGYTAERLRSSIRNQDPLHEIPKEMRREFVASLSPFERRQLERAYIHYAKMNSLRGYEAQLFPRANQPPAWRARHKPRYGILERQITGQRTMTGEQLAKRAHQAMMESLR